MNTRYYHVVTERPMELNQVIVFDQAHPNGVANRVKRVLELKENQPEVEADLPAFDKMVLENLGHWSNVASRELMLEKVRKEDFSEFPSRMACLYVSASLEEAEKWAKHFIEIGRETFQIVALENEGNCFTGDAHNCWYECASEEEARKRAFHYWKVLDNGKNEDPVFETIIDGRICVVEVIKDFRDNE
ncbi:MULTISPECIES: DUF2441 domain-containing protein [unclassified Fusibacter]|uniref:DUF2441 domain-containing protein n=1 Tax=unclassified Fusibacter TaxID=2624464 RepID=UPI001013A5B0|nr:MULTISPECIES: DUF2441 domain-containing protein [unclassified Fusibacter]MCK8061479.1 DUF2441 domain-containing protein [Fusibacter sp. A2]NPE23664.1 DUF2441 domain-containing protein [Fusibacter sp. A1]RXV58843.1 DUF2441 domain-containing protein [Fusibacter sp. A1]